MEVQGRRLRNANFCSSCQLCRFELGLSQIDSSHGSSRCWITFGCRSSRRQLVSFHFDLAGIWNPASSITHHNRGYLERKLNGGLEHCGLSCVMQPSCKRETNSSVIFLPSSDPWSHSELMSEDLLGWQRSMVQETWKTDADLPSSQVQRKF